MSCLESHTLQAWQATDSHGMLHILSQTPIRAQRHWERGLAHPWPIQPVQQVVICGMGGSGSIGDLLMSMCPDSQIPLMANKAETLPAWVNAQTLVIGVSYSGNTRETIACLAQAQAQGAQILSLSSGGQVATMARDYGWHHILLDGGLPPRTALFDMLSALMACLSHWPALALAPDTGQVLLSCLQRCCHAWDLHLEQDLPLPAQLAMQVETSTLWIWGMQSQTALLAARWKNQLAENAKVLSLVSILPELNHNEIVPMCAHNHNDVGLLALTLETGLSAQEQLSFDLTREHVAFATVLSAQGDTLIEQLTYLTCLGDYFSVYHALNQHCDPTPIAAIDELKRRAAQLEQ